MNISAVKERIHDYINNADERFLNLVYAMIQADMREEVYDLSDEEIKHLEDRLANYEANPDKLSSWDEVEKRVRLSSVI